MSYMLWLVLVWAVMSPSLGVVGKEWPLCCPQFPEKNGYPDISRCLVTCTTTIPSIMQPVSVLTGEAINLTVGIALNNLGTVNELDGTVTLDLYLRLTWDEPRFNLTNLFDAIAVYNPQIYGMLAIFKIFIDSTQLT